MNTDFQYRVASRVRIGDPVFDGTRRVYQLRGSDDRYFQLGEREATILKLFEPEASVDELVPCFKGDPDVVRLTLLGIVAQLQRLGVLELCVEAPAIKEKEPIRVPRIEREGARGRVVVADPSRLLAAMDRRFGAALSPFGVGVAITLAVAAVIGVAYRIPFYVAQVKSAGETPLILVITILAMLAAVVFHELAHGWVCTHFGGTATEIGVRWRIPFAVFYCRTDDIRVIHLRWRRAAVAAAGPVAVLVLTFPIVLAWWLSDDMTATRWLGSLSIGLVLSAVINLLPFFRLDGYVILNHMLGRADLAKEASSFVTNVVRRRRDDSGRVSRAGRVYAIATLCTALLAACVLIAIWYQTLSRYLAPWLAAAILAAEAMVVVVIALAAVFKMSKEGSR